MSLKLFTNGSFYCAGSYCSAILVNEGIIEQIYCSEPPKMAGVEYISLEGAWVYPGFTDTHTHSFEGGLYSAGVDLSSANNIPDVLDLLHEASKDSDSGEIVFAWRFDENNVTEKRFPSREELDLACPNNPLVLRRIDGHSVVLNTRALIQAGFSPDSNTVLRGANNDHAVHFFHSNCSPDLILRAYHSASEIALRGGFSSIHTMIGDAEQSNTHYRLLKEKLNCFKVRYHPYPQSFNLKEALELGSVRIGGCILADGSLGSGTAALSQPYEKGTNVGVLYQTDEFWTDFIGKAHTANLQVGVHCIGDRAIQQINDVYRKLQNTAPKDLRHQLIHCELTPDDLLDQIAESEAVAVMQPAFDRYWGSPGGFYEQVLGNKRAGQMNRFKSIQDRGIRLCFGSDWYITELDVFKGLYAAMNHHNPKERLGVHEAIAAYSANAAYLSGEEQSRGSLEIGKAADFTVINIEISQNMNPDEVVVHSIYRDGALKYVRL